MNNPTIQIFKYRLNMAAFACFVLAISAVQISYVLDGIRFLDLGILFLIPSFLFFVIWLLEEWTSESKDYCVGLTLLTAGVIIALLIKYKFQVGSIDDGYHNIKTIAYSVKNSFSSKFQVALSAKDVRFYYIDFIENIWGLALRFIRWDYVIVLIQILPVFILWRQLVEFFRNRKVEQSAGFLSAVIILSMQIIWAQACSTFIDSLTGIIAALTLLKIADLLSFRESRSFYNITTAALLSALCLLLKLSLVPLAAFGLGVSLWYGVTRLSKKEIFVTVLTLLPSLGYCIKHYLGVWGRQGNPFFPMFGSKSPDLALGWTSQGLQAQWYKGHYFNFKPFYVFHSWLYDYRLGFVTPCPTVDVGNGLLWTWVVVPILTIALVVSIMNIRKIKSFHPSVILLAFIVLYYYFMDFSVVARFMLGFHIFIMAWALAWIIGWMKKKEWAVQQSFSMAAGCFVLLLSLLSFFQAIKGALMEYKVVSVLEAQRELFPKYINAGSFQQEYCMMLLKDYQGQPVPDKLQPLINECKAGYYKQVSTAKDLKIRPQDYQFRHVLRNYENY